MKAFVVNPILGKEFISRMRSWKSPLVVSLYLGVLGLICLGYYWMNEKQMYYSGFTPDIGPQIYVILTVFQLMLVSFVTPALTAGVINGERERQTLDLLLCTRLSAASIVLNKLLASISYILLLILASLPVFSLVYFFGGVLLSEIAWVFLIYLVTAVTFGAIGIFCSTIFRRTQVSMVVSYIIVFFFLAGTLALAAFLGTVNMGNSSQPTVPWIAYMNPLVALFSIFPSYGMHFSISNFIQRISYGMGGGGIAQSIPTEALAPWQYNFILDGSLAVILLLITIILLDPVGRFARFRRKSK
jgi:ABC-type transport system involved in multi-copper enzyme maturation permease subunit